VAKEAAPAAVREAQLGDALIEVCQQRLEIGLPDVVANSWRRGYCVPRT
jgi:hypothetical protein